jgi:hypothetical protein
MNVEIKPTWKDDTVTIFGAGFMFVRVNRSELSGIVSPVNDGIIVTSELGGLPLIVQQKVFAAIEAANSKEAAATEAAAEAAATEANIEEARNGARFTLLSSTWKGIQLAASWRGISVEGAIKASRPHNQVSWLAVKGFVEPIGEILTVDTEYFFSENELLSSLGDYDPKTRTIRAKHIPKGQLIGHKGQTARYIANLVGFKVSIV